MGHSKGANSVLRFASVLCGSRAADRRFPLRPEAKSSSSIAELAAADADKQPAAATTSPSLSARCQSLLSLDALSLPLPVINICGRFDMSKGLEFLDNYARSLRETGAVSLNVPTNIRDETSKKP